MLPGFRQSSGEKTRPREVGGTLMSPPAFGAVFRRNDSRPPQFGCQVTPPRAVIQGHGLASPRMPGCEAVLCLPTNAIKVPGGAAVQLSMGNIQMNNPDGHLDRWLEEYLRSFVAEDILMQEAIKRAEQRTMPTPAGRVNDRRAAFKIVKSSSATPSFG